MNKKLLARSIAALLISPLAAQGAELIPAASAVTTDNKETVAASVTAGNPEAVKPAPVTTAPHADKRFADADEVMVVIGAHVHDPLTLHTDPERPRQPIPAADGAGYLKNIPGFSVVRKGGLGGDPVLRGMGMSRLGILIDDSLLLGGCGGRMDPPTAYVFPQSFQSITVLKGPYSVAHGGGNLAGVVMFDREPPQFAPGGGVQGQLRALVGSFGRDDLMARVETGNNSVYLRAAATRARGDDYRDGRGDEVRSFYERRNISSQLGYTPDNDTLLELSVERSEAEAAYSDRMMDGPVFNRESSALRFEKDFSGLLNRIEIQLFDNYIDHVMDNYSLRPLKGMKSASNPDREDTGGKIALRFAPGDNLILQLGADGHDDTHRLRGGALYASQPRLKDAAFAYRGHYVELEWKPEGWLLRSGLRRDAVETELFNAQGSFLRDTENTLHGGFLRLEQQSGSAGNWFVAVGQSERAPDFWERKRDLQLQLRPEQNRQFDVGYSWRSETLSATVSLFSNRIDDYILLRLPSSMRNVDAETRGGEIDLGWRLHSDWRLNASLSHVRGDNRTDHKPLAQLPPLEAVLSLQYEHDDWSGALVWRGVSKQDRIDIGAGNVAGQDYAATAGFATLGAHMGWQINRQWQLAAGIDNLFDKRYAEHLSRNVSPMVAAIGYEQTGRINEPGRTLWLSLGFSFE